MKNFKRKTKMVKVDSTVREVKEAKEEQRVLAQKIMPNGVIKLSIQVIVNTTI